MEGAPVRLQAHYAPRLSVTGTFFPDSSTLMAGRVTGLGDQRVEIAMMRTPDGHGRIEQSRSE